MRDLRRALVAVITKTAPNVTVNQIIMLDLVARHPGITVNELADRAEVNHSAASRFVDVFGSHGRGGREGFNLVERADDPDDRRMKRIHLTCEGYKLMREVRY